MRHLPQLPTPVLTEYVYVLARIALADKQLFLQLVSATAAAQNVKEERIWEPIMNQWWNRVSRPVLRIHLRTADKLSVPV